jgi:hypothetical protein
VGGARYEIKTEMSEDEVAFLFLVRNAIPQWEAWKAFFGEKTENVFVHTYPDLSSPLQIFDDRRICSVLTKWGDVSLVEAHLLMLKSALEGSPNSKMFVLLCESSLPIKNLKTIRDELLRDQRSRFNLFTRNVLPFPFPRMQPVVQHIDVGDMRIADQWCILNRKHAKLLVDSMQEWLPRWKDVFAPDETYPLTMLTHFKVAGSEQVLLTDNLALGATTFVHWPQRYYTRRLNYNTPEPYLFTNIGLEELQELLKSKSLFARKFSRDCMYSNDEQVEPVATFVANAILDDAR